MADNPRPPDAMPPQPNRMRPMQKVEPRPPDDKLTKADVLDLVSILDAASIVGTRLFNPQQRSDRYLELRRRLFNTAHDLADGEPLMAWVAVPPSVEEGFWTVWTRGLEQNYRVCLTAPDSLDGERLAREIVALHGWGRKPLSDGR